MDVKTDCTALLFSDRGALGIYLIPKIINVLDIGAVPLLEGSYVRAIIGAIILFLTTFWLVDYIVQLIKHIEEALVKAPVKRCFIWYIRINLWSYCCIFNFDTNS